MKIRIRADVGINWYEYSLNEEAYVQLKDSIDDKLSSIADEDSVHLDELGSDDQLGQYLTGSAKIENHGDGTGIALPITVALMDGDSVVAETTYTEDMVSVSEYSAEGLVKLVALEDDVEFEISDEGVLNGEVSEAQYAEVKISATRMPNGLVRVDYIAVNGVEHIPEVSILCGSGSGDCYFVK